MVTEIHHTKIYMNDQTNPSNLIYDQIWNSADSAQ